MSYLLFCSIAFLINMIKVSPTTLPGVLKIKRKLFKDRRGTFAVMYRRKEYVDAGIKTDFVQENSSSSLKNVLRGLHGDPKTWKLVSCTNGELYLVVLDYNRESLSFGKWESFVLTSDNGLQILIPPMHALGHLVLSDRATFHYKESEYYTDGKNQFTVKWNDSRFKISWPITNPILSDRDGSA